MFETCVIQNSCLFSASYWVLQQSLVHSKADIDNSGNYDIVDIRRCNVPFLHKRLVFLAKWFTLRMSPMVLMIIMYVIVIIINKLNITAVYYRACNTAISCTRTRTILFIYATKTSHIYWIVSYTNIPHHTIIVEAMQYFVDVTRYIIQVQSLT